MTKSALLAFNRGPARKLGLLHRDMLKTARNAVRYGSAYDLGRFQKLPYTDGDTYRALKNAVTELGEAAKKLARNLTQRHTETDWCGIRSLRDVDAHRYFQVDLPGYGRS